MPGPPLHSLVKYDTPSLLTSKKGGAAKKGAAKPGKKLPPVEAKPQMTQTEDILNSILPPRCARPSAAPRLLLSPANFPVAQHGRAPATPPPQNCTHLHLPPPRSEWTEDGQLWVQYVSSTPATRLDVINLQEQLDQRLLQRQARETGICPVREELYAQCFDELIRQVTINCAERGLLLLRVRDEIRMTIAAYQTLYESSIAFGMRKALQAEQGKADMEARIKQLEAEKKDLERQVQELKAKAEAIEKRESERRALEEKKHAEEVQFLKRTNAQLKKELETYLSPTRK